MVPRSGDGGQTARGGSGDNTNRCREPADASHVPMENTPDAMPPIRSLLLAVLLAAACGEAPSPGAPAGPTPASPTTSAPASPAGPPLPGRRAPVPGLSAAMTRWLFHLERFDPDRAAESFGEALALAPGLYPALFNRGLALTLAHARPLEAEALLREAAALEPGEAAPWFVLGTLLLRGVADPREEEALAAFREALARAPGDADARVGCGSALLQLRRSREALDVLGEAVRMEPRLGAALYLHAMALREEGREEEAGEGFRRFGEEERALRLLPREFVYGYLGPLGYAVRGLDRWVAPAPSPPSPPLALLPGPDVADPGGPFVVADLDGDGRNDLVLCGATPGWRRGEGDGNFGDWIPLPLPLPGTAGTDSAVGDLDGDGRADLATAGGVILDPAEEPRLLRHPFAEDPGRRHFLDFDGDGFLDLVVGERVLRGDGEGGLAPFGGLSDAPPPPPPPPRRHAWGGGGAPRPGGRHDPAGARACRLVPGGGGASLPLGALRAAVLADLDGDGDLDVLAAGEGVLRSWLSGGDAAARSLRITLRGVRNPGGPKQGWSNDRGVGTAVHVHVGDRVLSAVMGAEGREGAKGPPEVIHVGLGRGRADLVSLLWPEGLVQGEEEVPAGPVLIPETQRKTNW